VGDVFVEGGKVSLIGESLDVQADQVIDATGKYVLPGCVDPVSQEFGSRRVGST
jgi:dihydropyrimidinase